MTNLEIIKTVEKFLKGTLNEVITDDFRLVKSKNGVEIYVEGNFIETLTRVTPKLVFNVIYRELNF